MTTIAKIYSDLVSAMATVLESKYIFLDKRPVTNGGQTPMAKFAVIALPVAISDVAVGKNKMMLHTRGLFSLFVKSKSNGTLNVNAMSDLMESVEALFPISGTYSVAANPRPLIQGDDNNGYHYAEISFEIHTKNL